MTTVLGIIEWIQATTPTPSPTTDTSTEAASGWSSPQVGAALVALAGTLVLTFLNYLTSRANGRRQEQLHRESLIAQKDDSGQINAREQLRLRTERFGRAADQMGSDEPLVRMAGVYAMAALADEHEDPAQRQKCIDVLCGYLRLPPRTGTGDTDMQPGEEQVRVAIVDTIREHCQKDTALSWSELSFDFTGAQFHGPAVFDEAQFHGRAVFNGAQFHGPAWFDKAQFRVRAVFAGAQFHGPARFYKAQFHGDAWFDGAQFHGPAWFEKAQFRVRAVFYEAQFHGPAVFNGAQFRVRAVFAGAQFHGPTWFDGAQFHGPAWFAKAQFRVRAVFSGAQFHGEEVSFAGMRTVKSIDLMDATIPDGCNPTFTMPDGTRTNALPVIEANWDGTDPDGQSPEEEPAGELDLTDPSHTHPSHNPGSGQQEPRQPAQE